MRQGPTTAKDESAAVEKKSGVLAEGVSAFMMSDDVCLCRKTLVKPFHSIALIAIRIWPRRSTSVSTSCLTMG